MRIVQYGGGIHVAFTKSADARAVEIVMLSSHLIVLTEQGELALVRADPKAHQEITRFPAIEGKTWNHPAMSDGMLLIRNVEEMAAFNLRK